ncbi:hypothetical protein [Aeoliella mucimassa]|uniref:hypothetical protein n=1 Tax=Aeoliella mucimassa TaxID=2527972 RepID=UPI0011A0ACE9|nr:hypothetical protein [Aeoliella mucimassa]
MATPPVSLAGILIAPGTWIEQAENVDCVVVHIPPVSLEEELRDQDSINVEPTLCRAIREKYPQSGLYTSGDSPTLLWAFPALWLDHPAYVADDRASVVLPGDFTKLEWPGCYREIATFLSSSGEYHTVYYDDIAPHLWLKQVLAEDHTIRVTSTEYDYQYQEFSIRTNVGETITFDAATGQVKQYRDPIRSTLFVLAWLPALVLVFWIARRRVLSRRAVSSSRGD